LRLKDAFVGIVKLLIEPYGGSIEVDCRVKICTSTGEINTLDYMVGMCYECEDKTDDCCIKCRADVMIEDAYNDQTWFIDFNKQRGGDGHITLLRNKKEMFEWLKDFKKEIEWAHDERLEYLEKSEQLTEYAKEFFRS